MIDWISHYIPPWVWIAIIAHFTVLGTVAYLILLERKTASWVQDRIGPNRVGLGFGIIPFLKDLHMWGLGQPLADGLKFILKEDYRPKGVDRILFSLAPGIMITVVIISIAVLPWGGVKQSSREVDVTTQLAQGVEIHHAAMSQMPWWVSANDVVDIGERSENGHTYAEVVYRWPFQIANLNIGVLYVLAILSLAVYGIVIGGWASNNKYSFLGALRATANMISYEIPLGLSVLAIVLMYGTLDLTALTEKQCHYWLGFIPTWNVFTQPLGFLMFLVCIHAEANRAPFDLAEAEQELVGGYHTEYSSMRFALFFLAEYAGMITTSAVCVALFFGGWHLPWFERIPGLGPWIGGGNVDWLHPSITTNLVGCIIRAIVFFTKTIGIIFIFMWVRWSLPRFRFDQLMMLAWRALIPISLALVMVTAIVVYVMRHVARPGQGDTEWLSFSEALVLLIANGLTLAVAMVVSTLLPAPPDTNRKIDIPNSRFRRTPLPGSPVHAAAALDRASAGRLAVDPAPAQMGRMGA